MSFWKISKIHMEPSQSHGNCDHHRCKGVPFETVNVLDENNNPGVREAVKEFGQWPTQLGSFLSPVSGQKNIPKSMDPIMFCLAVEEKTSKECVLRFVWFSWFDEFLWYFSTVPRFSMFFLKMAWPRFSVPRVAWTPGFLSYMSQDSWSEADEEKDVVLDQWGQWPTIGGYLWYHEFYIFYPTKIPWAWRHFWRAKWLNDLSPKNRPWSSEKPKNERVSTQLGMEVSDRGGLFECPQLHCLSSAGADIVMEMYQKGELEQALIWTSWGISSCFESILELQNIMQ